MADVHSALTRSYSMSRIRSKHTQPELLVRKFLFANGYRYRLHSDKHPGKPDIILPKYKTVVFINGCFWHGHKNCRYFVIPKTRTGWWLNKINQNILNDRKKRRALKKTGWKVIDVWECDLKATKVRETERLLIRNLS